MIVWLCSIYWGFVASCLESVLGLSYKLGSVDVLIGELAHNSLGPTEKNVNPVISLWTPDKGWRQRDELLSTLQIPSSKFHVGQEVSSFIF